MEMGFDCYFHKENHEFVCIPNDGLMALAEDDAFEEELSLVENDPDKYIRIEGPSSSYSFRTMQEFALEMVKNRYLQTSLLDALEKKKPFRNFKGIIENSDYRDVWFSFKHEAFRKYLVDEINRALREQNEDEDFEEYDNETN